MSDFDILEAGDKVIRVSLNGFNEDFDIVTIQRRTKTLIYVSDESYNARNGKKRGAGSYSRNCIYPGTSVYVHRLGRLIEQTQARRLRFKIEGRLKTADLGELETVWAILNKDADK